MSERRRWDSHSFTVGAVVCSLGTGFIAGIVGLFVLAFYEKPIPGELIALVSASGAALPSLLAQTGRPASEQPRASATTETGDITQEAATEAPAESEGP